MELTLAHLLILTSLPLSSAKIISAYIFHRHGDRTTKSYQPVSLTHLGADQVFSSASYYRSIYLSPDSPNHITSLSSTTPILSQLSVTSPIDTVLQNSAQVFLSGLYPPSGTNETLANGTTVTGPLDSFNYIPVNAVASAASNTNSEANAWLQAGSGCGRALVSSNSYFASREYLDTYAQTPAFYQSLLPVVDSTFPPDQATYKNAYAIYDYVRVSTIHNATIPSSDFLTADVLFQLQTRASQHEWGLAFNETDTIRAIAGSVLAGQILHFLNASLTAPSSSPRLAVQFGAYATFMSFFGLASLPSVSEDFKGIVDYASSFVLELDDASNVSFYFVNGSASDTNPPKAFPLFGGSRTTIGWTDFVSGMEAFAVADTVAWCKACGETGGSCAEALGITGAGNATGAAGAGGSGGSGLSNAVAGVIGALVTLVVVLVFEGAVMGVAGLRLVKKRGVVSGAVGDVKA